MDPINQSTLQTICLASEDSLKRNFHISILNCTLNLISLISLAILFHCYLRVRITVHGNLLILFGNIVLLSFINSASYFALYFRHILVYLTYKQPCNVLLTLTTNALLLAPSYLYYFAYPLFHVCAMVERARATYLADKYEHTGHRLGYRMTIWIWIASILYTITIVYLAYIDPDLSSHPQPIVSLNSKYNGTPVMVFYMFTIPLTIFTALCDWRITVMNNRNLAKRFSKNSHNYSLSRNYQLNENTISMRLILPLDVFYAFLYTIFNTFTIVIRGYKTTMTTSDYIFYYYVANSLNYIYTAVTIIVYIEFVRFVGRTQKRNVYEAKVKMEMGQLYFKHLNAQWNA